MWAVVMLGGGWFVYHLPLGHGLGAMLCWCVGFLFPVAYSHTMGLPTVPQPPNTAALATAAVTAVAWIGATHSLGTFLSEPILDALGVRSYRRDDWGPLISVGTVVALSPGLMFVVRYMIDAFFVAPPTHDRSPSD
jgi:hypothetical protein